MRRVGRIAANRGTGMRTVVPSVTMYSAAQAQPSRHCGNNATMPSSAYDVIATVNDERATVRVTHAKI